MYYTLQFLHTLASSIVQWPLAKAFFLDRHPSIHAFGGRPTRSAGPEHVVDRGALRVFVHAPEKIEGQDVKHRHGNHRSMHSTALTRFMPLSRKCVHIPRVIPMHVQLKSRCSSGPR